MYDTNERAALANELAEAFLTGPWKAEIVAESGAGCLDRWPSWMSALALSVVAVHRTPPVDRRGDLVRLIETFLADRPARAGEPGPPRILRLLTDEYATHRAAHTRPQLEHDWPIAEIDSVACLAERLELSEPRPHRHWPILAGLAASMGLRYSRYADDLTPATSS